MGLSSCALPCKGSFLSLFLASGWPSSPAPFSDPHPLNPNGEKTNQPIALRGPFPSCLTTSTLKLVPGAASGPPPSLALGVSSARTQCFLLS